MRRAGQPDASPDVRAEYERIAPATRGGLWMPAVRTRKAGGTRTYSQWLSISPDGLQTGLYLDLAVEPKGLTMAHETVTLHVRICVSG